MDIFFTFLALVALAMDVMVKALTLWPFDSQIG
jgi:hypothetical protein